MSVEMCGLNVTSGGPEPNKESKRAIHCLISLPSLPVHTTDARELHNNIAWVFTTGEPAQCVVGGSYAHAHLTPTHSPRPPPPTSHLPTFTC